jgi:hypothetical protein
MGGAKRCPSLGGEAGLMGLARAQPILRAATAPLRRRNLEGRFVLRLERHRVRRRAGALIAGPVDTNRIGVTLVVCHGLLPPAARGYRGTLSYRAIEAQQMAAPKADTLREGRRGG